MTDGVRLDHCVIAVSDWKRSVAFYRDVLRAQIVEHPDGRVVFRFGDQQLNVHGPGVDAGPLVANPPVAPGGSDLCFVWPGTVEAALLHLDLHGVALGRDRCRAAAVAAAAPASTSAIPTVDFWS